MRVGILGGAFNPPHVGHLVCAQEAHAVFALDRVVFVPVGQAPHREIEPEPGPELRYAMVAAAVADDERFSVSRIELDRAGPSYTVDTLRALRGISKNDELFLVLGADQAAELSSWHEPEEIMRLCTVCVAERPGMPQDVVLERTAMLMGAGAIRFFNMPEIAVSSTLVRRRVQSAAPIRYFVCDEVQRLIAAHNLYQVPTHSTS